MTEQIAQDPAVQAARFAHEIAVTEWRGVDDEDDPGFIKAADRVTETQTVYRDAVIAATTRLMQESAPEPSTLDSGKVWSVVRDAVVEAARVRGLGLSVEIESARLDAIACGAEVRISRLHQPAAALPPSDTERMDWLEQKRPDIICSQDDDDIPLWELYETAGVNARKPEIAIEGTLRQAIDRASGVSGAALPPEQESEIDWRTLTWKPVVVGLRELAKQDDKYRGAMYEVCTKAANLIDAIFAAALPPQQEPEAREAKRCPKCNGRGFVGGNPYPCDDCAGRGTVLPVDSAALPPVEQEPTT
jgi:hypothetical protein